MIYGQTCMPPSHKPLDLIVNVVKCSARILFLIFHALVVSEVFVGGDNYVQIL